MAAAILIPFDVVGRVDPRDRVLEERAHQYHLENTVKRLCAADMSGSATRAGDAACSQLLWAILLHLTSVQLAYGIDAWEGWAFESLTCSHKHEIAEDAVRGH